MTPYIFSLLILLSTTGGPAWTAGDLPAADRQPAGRAWAVAQACARATADYYRGAFHGQAATEGRLNGARLDGFYRACVRAEGPYRTPYSVAWHCGREAAAYWAAPHRERRDHAQARANFYRACVARMGGE